MSKMKKIDLDTGKVLDWTIDRELLTEAFTHPNYVSENPNAKDFERLEFLGDAVLDLLSAEWLYRDTVEEVGIMSQLRSLLVRTNALAEVGKDLGIAKHLRTESKYHVVETDLEDVVEALFGAFYLSQGRDITRAFFEKIFLKNLQQFKKDIKDEKGRERILKLTVCENNPINMLQEFFQKKDLELPEYSLLKKKGSDHDPTFHMECKVVIETQQISTIGKGHNRKAAKKDAADKMFKKLKID
ncbi:MAG: ribonuclease III family protein [Candidatus Heimdallarchaeaceae archaeon]